MKKIYCLNIIMLFVFCGGVLASMPAKYQTCSMKVKEPKESTGFFWSRDCKGIYVLPPAKNIIKIDSMSLNVATQECKSLKILMDSYLLRIKKIKQKMKNAGVNESEIKRVVKKITSLRRRKEKYSSMRLQLLEKKGDARMYMIPIDKMLVSKSDELLKHEIGSYKYQRVMREISSLKKKKLKIVTIMEQVDLKLEVIDEQEKEITKEVVRLSGVVNGLYPASDDSLEEIAKLVNDLNDNVSTARNSWGGTIKVYMENLHNKLVKRFKKLNPGVFVYKISAESSIQFKVAGMAGMLNDVAREVNIPGVSVMNDSENVLDGYANITFGESMSGSVDISSLAACMIKMNETSSNGSLAKFVVNTLYHYDLSVKNDYNLTYNMKEVYSKIKKSTSSGGLFKSKSMNSITESLTQSNGLRVEFNSEDPRDNFDNEAKKEIKTEFLARTLGAISKAYIPYGSSRELSLPEARETGIQNASGSVKKCMHVYCQVAGMALDLSHALFGSQEQTATFLKTQDFVHTESFKETKAYRFSGTSTFVTEESL